MTNNHVFNILVLLSIATFIAACGGNKPETSVPETTAAQAATPDPEPRAFVPLVGATTAAEVPFVMGSEGVKDIPCFSSAVKVTPAMATAAIEEEVGNSGAAVKNAMVRWFVDELQIEGLGEDVIGGWEVVASDLRQTAVPVDALRFEENQKCIGKKNAKIKKSLRIVTGMVGAREFTFKAPSPVSVDTQDEIIAAVGAYNIVLDSEDLFVWEVERDSDNAPKVDQNGEELYRSPDGSLIPASEVPPMDERGMSTWTLKAEEPIYFAYSEMTDEYFRREGKKKKCDVYLIWGDSTPRKPECPEFTEVGFVAKDDGDKVEVTIHTEETKKKVVLKHNKLKMVPIDDRVMIWLKPKKDSEGVLLRVNSLVVSPRPMVGAPAEPEAETPALAPAPAAAEDKPKKKKSGNAVDDYLTD